MKIIKLNKNESTFAEDKKDLRPFEKAWREDFPNSKPVPKSMPIQELIMEYGFYHD